MAEQIDGTWPSDPARVVGPSRREFLCTGVAGLMGLGLGDLLRAEAQAAEGARAAGQAAAAVRGGPAAKSVIQIFLPGGLAAQESFDPKPDAPAEYRGPFGSIPTKLPGVRFGEHLKRTAEIADRLTVIRSMSHDEATHERATRHLFTAVRPGAAIPLPSMGSVVSHELGDRNRLPAYICVPHVPNAYAGAGCLSSRFGPFALGNDAADKSFVGRDLSLPQGLDEDRFDRRRNMLDAVEHDFRVMEESDVLEAMDAFCRKAHQMLSAPEARQAFDIHAEPEKVRQRYGQHSAGRRMLMCRRLVEAGVRFVSMACGGWDHHQHIADGIARQLPPFDQAYAALIRDLEERGMLDSTLVVLSTEFGRTPTINQDGGRDHYPRVFSVVLAGGGIRRGLVHGASDATASAVEEAAVGVPDLAKTIYRQIGLDAGDALVAPGGRPIEIVQGGRVIEQILA